MNTTPKTAGLPSLTVRLEQAEIYRADAAFFISQHDRADALESLRLCRDELAGGSRERALTEQILTAFTLGIIPPPARLILLREYIEDAIDEANAQG
ncbi:hypothetical protein ACT3TZ_13895 [Brachybacterium sp. AOP25-B2-12]|uniref:hypothetical protein n=1 Tax=Brachybacterium sp. AOP25-B2-12 TaxID=3457710 RepID=UPI0040332508